MSNEYDRHNPSLAIGRTSAVYETDFNPIAEPLTGNDVVKLFRASDRNYWRTQLLKLLRDKREQQRRQLANLYQECEQAFNDLENQPRARR